MSALLKHPQAERLFPSSRQCWQRLTGTEATNTRTSAKSGKALPARMYVVDGVA
jgi:hypothetical protein